MSEHSIVSTIIHKIQDQIVQGSDFLDVDGVLQLNITGDPGGSIVIDLTELEGRIYEGQIEDADCMISIMGEDYLSMQSGAVSVREAFMAGKIKIEGDVSVGAVMRVV